MYALMLPPFDLWPLALLAPVPLAWAALKAQSARQIMLATFITQWAMWLWLNRWVVPVTALGYPLLGLYMSIWPTLWVWMIFRIGQHRVTAAWPMTLLLPLTWVAVEFLRGDVIFGGYPWYVIAHPLVEWPVVVQSADLFGKYFISFLAAMFAGVVVDTLRKRSAAVQHAQHSQPTARGIAVTVPLALIAAVVAIHLANLGYGWWRMNQTDPLSPGPRILAIQTNLPQNNKLRWTFDDQLRDVNAFIKLTRDAFEAAGGREQVDLIVWPETMVPGWGFEPQALEVMFQYGNAFEHLYWWPSAVYELSVEFETPMLVGSAAFLGVTATPDPDKANTIVLQREREYNSAYLVEGLPPYQRYDKVVLTPYGETMPLFSNWPWLEEKLLAVAARGMQFNLDAAQTIERLEFAWPRSNVDTPHETANHSPVPSRITLATPICFEDTVAWLNRKMVYDNGNKVADVLVNLSNDGWFSFSHADRKLHAQIARFRCIENRVPMVRSVNTGMTVAIDSAGRLVGAAGSGRYGEAEQAGWLAADVTLDSRHTLYGRIGDAFAWVCLIASTLLVGWIRIRSQ